MSTASATVPEQPNGRRRVAFYFSAHQDDWQLFMNPPAFRDVLDDTTHCVFVHMTAGDAGLGTGAAGRKHPFYLARDDGAETAIRFMADANDRPPIEPTIAAKSFAGHAIRRVAYRNTVAYFLHAPDGNPEGGGYVETGYQSLKRLAKGEIETLSAVDGSSVYHGWDDLLATLRGIIDFERGSSLAVDLHIPEIDSIINANDHADHLATADAVLRATKDMPSRCFRHLGYACIDRRENLAAEDRDMQCAVFAVTLAGITAMDHAVSWQYYRPRFIGRSYYRVEQRELN